MPTREALQLLERYNQAIADLEQSAVARLNNAMNAAYRDLEGELRSIYPAIAQNDTLLATQRKVLILEQLGETLSVVREADTEYYQQTLQDALATANQTGRTLADELVQAIAPNSGVPELGNVNLEAAALQARDGFQRLRRYSDEFKDKASAVIEQGLIQGWGPAKVADILREQLKTTKSKAETIARTETLSALNDAAQQRYAANGIEGVQWVCTIGDVCPYCVHRNMKVYPVGKVRCPAHPRCRCVLIPWRSAWQADGLTDDEFTQNYQDQRLSGLAKLGQKPNSGPTPFEKAAGLTSAPQPLWTLESGLQRSRPTTLPSNHLITGDPRFNAQSFDQGLEQIKSEGAAERVALFRQFANNQQIQVVVWDENASVAAQRLLVQTQLKDQEFLKILADRGALTKYTEPIAGAEAYTLRVARHLALTTDTERWYTPAGPFAVKGEHLKLAAEEIFKNAAKGEDEESIYFGVDSPLRGRNISRREAEDSRLFIVYLHEMGHQVHYTIGRPWPPEGIAGSATDYGATNEQEWFAEHFALWMLDAKGYAKLDPVGAKFIEQSVKDAAAAPLRELPRS